VKWLHAGRLRWAAKLSFSVSEWNQRCVGPGRATMWDDLESKLLLFFSTLFIAGWIWVSLTEDDSSAEQLDQDSYPTCAELMQYPGTAASAMCRDGDDLIEAQDYSAW